MLNFYRGRDMRDMQHHPEPIQGVEYKKGTTDVFIACPRCGHSTNVATIRNNTVIPVNGPCTYDGCHVCSYVHISTVGRKSVIYIDFSENVLGGHLQYETQIITFERES